METPEVENSGRHNQGSLGSRPGGTPRLSIYRQPTEILAEASRVTSGLPIHRTSFVGRAAELARAGQLLAESRLLTLMGPGGCGKTRLAIRLASSVSEEFPAGAIFVDLAPLDRAASVLGRVAEAVAVDEPEDGSSVTDAICRRLSEGPILLVLDSCEHVINDAAQVVGALLSGAPDLTIMATSREPLAVEGELSWVVPAMNTADAAALFKQRAAAVRPDRNLDSDDEEAVAAVCRQLDGLPLAIELAAARTRALSARQIAVGLEKRFELLANGPRTVPARHVSLRASMDWSYELLDEAERILFRHLGVFAGGFDLDAIFAVCPEAHVEQLAALVDRSLVVATDTPGDTRYRLLQTIRSYAVEKLLAGDEHVGARSRHRDHYLALAEMAEPMIGGFDQLEWMNRLRIEHDNVMAALVWSDEQRHAEQLVRLAVSMTPFWLERSQWTECRVWLDSALAMGDVATGLRAKLLICLCYLETWIGRWAMVPLLASDALTAARTAGARREEGRALGYLAVITALAMGSDPARPYFEDALELAHSTGDSWGVSNLCTFFSLSRLFQAEPEEPTRLLDEATAIARERGDGRTLRTASAVAALVAASHGDLEKAACFAGDVVGAARRAEHWSAVILGLASEGWVRLIRGDFTGGTAAAAEAVEVARESGESQAFQSLAMSVWGWSLRRSGARDVSAELLNQAVDLMRASELPRWAGLPLVLLAELQIDLGDDASARASLEEAISGATTAGYPWILGRAKQAQARLLVDSEDYEGAESWLNSAISLHKTAADLPGWCDALEHLATVSAARGHADVALRLWGAVESRRIEFGYAASPETEHRQMCVAEARRAVGPGAEGLWAEGGNLDLDQATSYAARLRGKRGRPSSGWQSLTPTELEIVRLVGQHLTNPEIAERLFVSRATVKTHLVHVFAKLNLTSRSQLAVEAAQHGV